MAFGDAEVLVEVHVNVEQTVAAEAVPVADLTGVGEAEGGQTSDRVHEDVGAGAAAGRCRSILVGAVGDVIDLSGPAGDVVVGGPGAAVANGSGQAGSVAVDAADLPAAEDGIHKAVPVAGKLLAFAEGETVDIIRIEVMALVKVGRGTHLVAVVGVDDDATGGGGAVFGSGTEVDRVRPGPVEAKAVAAGEALLDTELEGVVGGEADGAESAQVGELRAVVGVAAEHGRCAGGRVEQFQEEGGIREVVPHEVVGDLSGAQCAGGEIGEEVFPIGDGVDIGGGDRTPHLVGQAASGREIVGIRAGVNNVQGSSQILRGDRTLALAGNVAGGEVPAIAGFAGNAEIVAKGVGRTEAIIKRVGDGEVVGLLDRELGRRGR